MKRLVLLGGGHAHVQVLAAFAASRPAGWQVDLVTPCPRLVYSGTLAGWMAGHYDLASCTLPLAGLAHAAGVRLHLTSATGLDLARNEALCADGHALPFDLMSINTGPEPALDALPGASEHALALRPLETFVEAWPSLLQRMQRTDRPFDLVVVGQAPRASSSRLPFDIGSARTCAIASGSRSPATIHCPCVVRPIVPGAASRRGSRRGKSDGWGDATQRASAPAWLSSTIQPRSRPMRASLPPALQRRRGPRPRGSRPTGTATSAWTRRCAACLILACSPRATWRPITSTGPSPASTPCGRRAGAHRQPARRRGRTPAAIVVAAGACLYILGTGGRHALAWRGPSSISGRWVWRWKDRIDRRFVRRFSK